MYATTTTLAIRMININFDTATTALAVEMISDAEAEVNKWLSRRYDLSASPFDTTTSIPPIVRALSTRLAEGYMWQGMSRGAKESLSRGKELIEQVMTNLKAIAAYEVDLLDTSGSAIVDMSNTAYRVLSSTTNYTPTFNEDDPLNWAQDEDKLSDISNERD